MGAALSDQVAALVSGFLEADSGKLSVGLSSSYHVTSARLRPLALGKGLWLTGSVADLHISVDALKVVTSIFRTAAPAKLTIRGAALLISDSDPGPKTGQQRTPVRVESHAASLQRLTAMRRIVEQSPMLQQQSQKMLVELRDVSVEIRLTGCDSIRSAAVALDLVPQTGTDGELRWEARHVGARLQCGAAEIAALADGRAALRASVSPPWASVYVPSEVRGSIGDSELLAVLDIVEALSALADGDEVIKSDRKGPVPRLKLAVDKLHWQLRSQNQSLLKLQGRRVTANIANRKCELHCAALAVAEGVDNGVSGELMVQALLPSGKPTLMRHGYAPLAFPPWRGAVEALAADPRFSAHSQRLTELCDGFAVELMAKPSSGVPIRSKL